MERWVKVVLGTLFGSLAAFVFYLIFERVMQYRRRVRQRESETAHRAGEVSMRVKVKLGRENLVSEEQRNAEMERLVYEEYETDKHEVLAISLETDTVAVGICCFLSDREIEFYWEKFPECCVKNRDGDDHVARNMMAAVSHWATKWTLAEAVNFLVRSRDLVVLVSKGTTRQWRQIAQYEKRHSFNFFIQWAENFICDEVAGEELWEEVVAAARMLANSTEAEVDDVWENFPVAHWRRKRVRLQGENFHCVPHPGDVTPDVSETEAAVAALDVDVAVTNSLVSL